MNLPPDPEQPGIPASTGRRRTVWPNLVWGIPVAALLIVGYLGVEAVRNRGEVVTVTFSKAAGAKAGETKVVYQGVEAGKVIDIKANPDGRRLDFRLRLVREAKNGLNTNARFWLIGASPTLSDLSSLKAVVSGVAVGYAPGDDGAPVDAFEGLDHEPLLLPGDRGTRYVLSARSLNSIHEGTIVLFHGQPIGKVIEVKFDGRSGFRLQVFMFRPYDSLVRAGARFWKISPLKMSFAGGGVTANLAPASTLLAGGIDLEVDTSDPAAAQSKADTEFTLYSSHNAARQGLSGPTVRYEFAFEGAAGTLDETSAVTLLGFQIGEVESARLAYREVTGTPYTLVTALVYPRQMHLAAAGGEDWRAITDAALAHLTQVGYRARLEQTPPLFGEASIDLAQVRAAPAAHMTRDGANPRFPSAPGSDSLDDITVKVDQIMNKLNAIPLEQIGLHIEHMTANLDRLTASPELKDGLTHLHATLKSVDQMLGEVRPQVSPLIAKLNQAAAELTGTAQAAHRLLDGEDGSEDASLPDAIRQITEAARSIGTLTDYLDRHPEALIRGKRPDK